MEDGIQHAGLQQIRYSLLRSFADDLYREFAKGRIAGCDCGINPIGRQRLNFTGSRFYFSNF